MDIESLKELLVWLEVECVWPVNALIHADKWTQALADATQRLEDLYGS